MISNSNWVIIDIFMYILMILPLFFSIKYSNKKYWIETYKGSHFKIIYFIFLFLFCLYDKTSGDYFHYQELVYDIYVSKDNPTHIESFYVWIIKLVNGNYFLFRVFVWGPALLLLFGLVDKLKLNISLSLWSFILIGLVKFSYPRVSLGLIILFYGYIIFLDKGKFNKFIGIFIIIISTFFHKSLYILIPIILFSLIPLKKWMLTSFIIIIPILISFINEIVMFFLPYLSFVEFNYLNIEKQDWGLAFKIYNYLFYTPIFYIIYLCFKIIFIKKESIYPKEFLYLFKLSLYIILFSIIISALPFGSEAISTRVRLMSLIPLSILLSYILKYEIINCKIVLSLILLFISNLYNLFYMYYLKKIGLGI